MCPFCLDNQKPSIKKGFFKRRSGRLVQRFRCQACKRTFSTQTGRLSYREKKPGINQTLYFVLNSGMSQRRASLGFGVKRSTIARKLVRFGKFARHQHQLWLRRHAATSGTSVVIDEMETLEHTKMKPLAIAVGVEHKTRYILGAEVRRMPAKGLLAERSRRKYGYRKDERRSGLLEVLANVAVAMPGLAVIKSDECPRYPRLFLAAFPNALLKREKSRRACTVGQGEMKVGGFDPLFSLNHSCAMFRDNLKTLSRRTWCTPKRPDRLQALVDIYVTFHNSLVANPKICPLLDSGPIIGAS